MTFDELITQSLAPDNVRLYLSAYMDTQINGEIASKDRLSLRSLAPLLPNTTLLEREADDKIIYRIAGENIQEKLGFNPTGQNLLDLIAPDAIKTVISDIKIVLTKPCGHYSVYESRYQSGCATSNESVVLPMRQNTSPNADLILGFHTHHQPADSVSLVADTQLYVSRTVGHFVDVGFGLPAN